ncbi:hypothetical protein [Pandoraea pulmonicola]|uniref:Zinc ribbon domain-containing protein n=1 Tax=Pandoraea pulmonicola TaxID=93221 RepID=A0AAJ4ZGJ5_PANPU|nr:hypothetical protein [Pandoraea pulmonicola]AJC22816.2 hypothetical protein RO07_24400 [Pandoraea pulmonicola]SUA92889.1 Uncharacterised protein [Pandoraea pulmonicola]
MTLKFRNPASGDVVEITYMSCVAAFFLGPLYLLAYGFAWHALIWTLLAIGPALLWRESALAISLPLTCLLYSLMIHPLLIGRLRANGWVPTREDALPSARQRGYDGHTHAVDETACPYCAETIKRQAVRCRHCLANLPATSQ